MRTPTRSSREAEFSGALQEAIAQPLGGDGSGGQFLPVPIERSPDLEVARQQQCFVVEPARGFCEIVASERRPPLFAALDEHEFTMHWRTLAIPKPAHGNPGLGEFPLYSDRRA